MTDGSRARRCREVGDRACEAQPSADERYANADARYANADERYADEDSRWTDEDARCADGDVPRADSDAGRTDESGAARPDASRHSGDAAPRATVRADGGTPRAIGVPDAAAVDEGAASGDVAGDEVASGEPTPSVEDVVDAIEAAGGTATVASPADLLCADLAAIVAPREGALRALATVAEEPREPDGDPATAAASPPVLPVGCAAGVRSVAPEALEGALASLLDGPSETVTYARAAVSIDGDTVDRVLRQVAIVTAEPAGISEFAIAADGVGDVDAVRADGVVVATPAGSPGYGAAGDGPLLAPNTGLAAIPVAPFRTDRPRWVLPDDGVTVRIRRDEAPVAVEVDGDVRRTVGQDATVRVERDGEFDVALVEESAAPFR